MASAFAVMIVASSAALANTPGIEMEKAYWDCEFAASEGQISLDAAAACSEIYELLKKVKFGGRFDVFLAWWRENKVREMSSRAVPGRAD